MRLKPTFEENKVVKLWEKKFLLDKVVQLLEKLKIWWE